MSIPRNFPKNSPNGIDPERNPTAMKIRTGVIASTFQQNKQTHI